MQTQGRPHWGLERGPGCRDSHSGVGGRGPKYRDIHSGLRSAGAGCPGLHPGALWPMCTLSCPPFGVLKVTLC